MPASVPRASIVVRTFNEERHLGRLLEILAAQTVTDHEVIVVDSGSFDRTRDIARAHGARLLEIDSRDFTFGYSLNVGLRAARGPIVVIVSAHTEPLEARWLEHMIAPFGDEDVAMVYGRQVGAPVSKFGERLDFERTFGTARLRMTPNNVFTNNANSAVRRSLWEQEPFDERLPGLEDIAWAKRWIESGRVIVYEPAAAIRHIHEESWPQVYRRYYREAAAARQIGIKNAAHIVPEVVREITWLLGDVGMAAKEGVLGQRLGEVLLFRIQKTRATVAGLARNGKAVTTRRRQELFFDRDYTAVVIHGPQRASLDRVEVGPPAPRDVLVRVAYVGVCGTDLEILDGRLGYFESGLSSYPITPGHEFSGHVAAVGAKVADLAPGDPVVVECIQSCHACDQCRKGNFIACADRREVGVMRQNGAYAEYVTIPARFVHRLAEGTDLKRAALCEPLAVVLKGLKRLARLVGTDAAAQCAVVGGGPIGWLATQVLRHRGNGVVVFDRDEGRRALYRASGIATGESLADLPPFDTVVEATGDPDALQQAFAYSRPGCTLLLLGLPYARHDFSFEHIVAFDKTVMGSVGSSATEFREAIALLPDLAFEPLTSAVRPLEEFENAWASFRRREHLKILLKP
jgi:threonine dehydrogenase-like Zn-dependent dehydrogenase/glycosyltransferase involved in cell wall biosynthesis